MKAILPALAALFVWGAVSSVACAQGARQRVDLELVLAVDVSASMDEDEHLLQRRGYSAAFRSPQLINAVKSGYGGKIVVTYMEWAGAYEPNQTVGWTLINSEASARAFADKLDAAPIYAEQRTSISTALTTAAALMDSNAYDGARRVIDVSGDGANNVGPPVLTARAAVLKKGITINGIPIMLGKPPEWYDIPNLDRYYRDCVIGGTSAFLIPVHNINELAGTIRRKLVMEVAGVDPRGLAVTPDAPNGWMPAQANRAGKADCLAGEKAYNSRMGDDFDFGGRGFRP
jgi:hypothetical protein